MSESRISLTSVTVVVVLLALAISVVVWTQIKDDLVLIMLFLLIIGVYCMVVGLGQRVGQGSKYKKANANYTLFWGNLLAILSLLVLVDHYYPGNVIWLFVVFIVWLAIAVLLFTMRPKAKQ